MGIGPTYLAWKASVLPLNYTRIPLATAKIIPPAKVFVNSFLQNKQINIAVFLGNCNAYYVFIVDKSRC